MLNLPRQTFKKLQGLLLRQQKEVKQQLESIEIEDPISLDNIPEASESGTDSWQAEAHGRLVRLKNDLLDLSKRIANSLTRIKKGTYEKCEKCGNAIELERLKAMPTATLCIACSKKPSKKSSR